MSFTTAERRAIKKMLADGIALGLADGIPQAIKINVNGKIDKMQAGLDEHNTKHENDMKRMMPVIESYEEKEKELEVAKKGGKIVMLFIGVITAVGGAYLIILQVLSSLRPH